MKKLRAKHEEIILKLKIQENKHFVIKSIFQNFSFFALIRWKAYSLLESLVKTNSKVSVSFRCAYTVNRKRFNTLAPFSRYVLLRLIRTGNISGLKKASW